MSSTNTVRQEHQDQGARLALVVERVLRPFIKLIVGRVSCGFLIQQIKRIYIEEARRWIRKNDAQGRVTKSKLAMLTGLDTRTISAIESNVSGADECTLEDLCPEAGILDKWRTNESFLDPDGKPKILPILGRGVTFQALVTSLVGRNVTSQTVLERLIESGNVEVVDDNFVRLINPFYQPIRASEQTIIDAGSWSISRLSDTVCRNLDATDNQSKMLQQDRWSRRIPADEYPSLKRELRGLLERQIEEVESVIEKYESNTASSNDRIFGVGWFTFSGD